LDDANSSWYYFSLLLAAILGAFATGLFKFYIEWWKDKQLKKARQIQVHSNLLGCKQAILQYYNTYLGAIISSEDLILNGYIFAMARIDYTEYNRLFELRKKDDANQYTNRELRDSLRESYDLREGLSLRNRIPELELLIGKTSERLWVIIGRVKTLFPNSKVTNQIKKIEDAMGGLEGSNNFIGKLFIEIFDKMKKKPLTSNENRGSWYVEFDGTRKEKVSQARSEVETKTNNVKFEIDKLLHILEDEINNPKFNRECILFCSSYICPLKPSSLEGINKKANK